MKTFLKRAAITFGVLAFAAVVMAAVYIDSTVNYLRSFGFGVQLVVTNNVAFTANGSRFDLPGNLTLRSNLVYTNIAQFKATNTTAITNLTINFNQPVNYFIVTNNATFTNFTGVPTNGVANTLVVIESAETFHSLTWPTLGAPSFGTYWNTNGNAPLFTSGTNGQKICISLTAIHTQVLASMVIFK